MDLTLIGILGIAIMIGLILLGVNIGMAMFAVGFAGFALVTKFEAAMGHFPYSSVLQREQFFAR
jgi:hypothetical protein